MFERTQLRTKVLGISGLFLSLAAVVAAVGFYGLQKVDHEVEQLSQHTTPATFKLLNIDRDAYQSLLGLEQALSATDEAAIEGFLDDHRSNAGQLSSRWDDFLALAGEPVDAEEAALRDGFTTGRDHWVKLCASSLDRGLDSTRESLEVIRTGFQAMREPLDQLEEGLFEARAATHVEDINSTSAASRTWMFVALAVAITLGGLIASLFARSISRPIQRLTIAAERIASGDVEVDLDTTRGDELGVLTRAFSDLATSMKGYASKAQAMANGDLSVTIESRGENDVLAESFQQMVESLREMVESIREASSAMEGSATELGRLSSGLRDVADETAEKALSVSSSGEEMQACISEIAKSAGSVASIAKNAVKLSDTTGVAMDEMQRSSGQISEVSELIANIAEQTNLLALNATIEAARAGEAGKGFAVVAGEVKELALETGNATSKIATTVGAVQARADEAAESIGSVNEVIQKIDMIASSIAGAVEEQSVTTTEIARNIAGVATAAEKTQMATAQAETAAQNVSKLALDLRQSVEQFHTN